jgi:hypothetical protein
VLEAAPTIWIDILSIQAAAFAASWRTTRSRPVYHELAKKENNMGTALKSARAFLTLLSLSLFCSGCQANHSPEAPSPIEPSVSASSMSETLRTTAAQTLGARPAGNTNGAAGQMPAYHDGQLFTVNMKEMPDKASDSTIGKNPSLNEIYASNDLDEEQDFIPVIDAIQGDGFNPLWRQILIVFNAGFTPHQFFSEEQIEAAAAGQHPEITLVETDEVYRCSVVDTK